MERGIIITLPTSDEVTEYLSAFSKEIIDACPKNQVLLKKIEKKDVTKSYVENMIKKMNYKMIIFNGHGAPDCICGYKDEKIISLGENENLLKNRITYSRSCWSIMQLGQECMKKNEGCFIGYLFPFEFIINKNWAANPLKDNIAKVFFDTSNLVALGLIKGNTAKESNNNSKRSMLKVMNKILNEESPEYKAILETLWVNYNSQKLIGNGNERLV